MSPLPPAQRTDEDRTRRVLSWIVWPSYAIIAGGAAVFLGLGISQRPELTVLFHGCGFGVVLLAHAAAHRGRLTLASDLLITLFFVTYVAAAGLSGGTTSPYMGGFLLVIVGAAILRGGAYGIGMAGLAVVASVGFVLLDRASVLPPSLMPLTPTFSLVAWTLILGMTAVLLQVTVGELQQALTAQRRALDELHRTSVSKASVEGVLLGLGDAVFVLDASHVIRDVNLRAQELLGWTHDELIGRPFFGLLVGEGRTGRAEVALQTSQGSVFVSMSQAPLHGLDGQVDGVVIVAHDIDARVAAEQRTQAAAVEAEQASRAKSGFLATMSHELRTPLNAIIGYAEFVQEELDDDGLSDDVGRIERSGRDLLALIDDVLDLSKIEAGRIELELREEHLPALVDDVAAQIAPLIARNGNQLDVSVAPGVGTVRTDPTRLRQILRNLLSNAAKFTEHGRITLEVTEAEHTFALTVADTGLGMTPAQLQRVWEPFAQAEASTTRRFGGTGLGLPITLHLCELLGGSVDVRSEPGQGTCFVVTLPKRPVVGSPRS